MRLWMSRKRFGVRAACRRFPLAPALAINLKIETAAQELPAISNRFVLVSPADAHPGSSG